LRSGLVLSSLLFDSSGGDSTAWLIYRWPRWWGCFSSFRNCVIDARSIQPGCSKHYRVMRASRVAFFTVGMGAGCVVVWSIFLWHHRPSSVPAASITLVGYTNITLSNPDTNVFVYPGRGKWLHARVTLKNEGTASISYAAWGDEPSANPKVSVLTFYTQRGLTLYQ